MTALELVEPMTAAGRPRIDEREARELADRFADAPAEDVLSWAFNRFGDGVALVSSFQAEAMVLLDMAVRLNPAARVLTIDTGRLPHETYDLIDQVRRRYGIRVEVFYPEARAVERMVSEHGFNLFYDSLPNRFLCCHHRKVDPLQRALSGLDAWVTGLRREGVASRAHVRKVDFDEDHGGLLKLSPLADWTHDAVWNYLQRNEVPYHPYYDQGYTSIGCAPCTRPTPAGADARAGRWWWETDAPKECGMHCSLETGRHQRHAAAVLARYSPSSSSA